MAWNKRKKNPRIVPTLLSNPGTPPNPPAIVQPAVMFTKGFVIRPWKDSPSKIRRRKIRGWFGGR